MTADKDKKTKGTSRQTHFLRLLTLFDEELEEVAKQLPVLIEAAGAPEGKKAKYQSLLGETVVVEDTPELEALRTGERLFAQLSHVRKMTVILSEESSEVPDILVGAFLHVARLSYKCGLLRSFLHLHLESEVITAARRSRAGASKGGTKSKDGLDQIQKAEVYRDEFERLCDRRGERSCSQLLKSVAQHFGVSQATVDRSLRKYGFNPWEHFRKTKPYWPVKKV
jgi:hypothetical protein